MAKKYTAIAVFGLMAPFGTPEAFDTIVQKYKTARLGTADGMEIINEALERTFIPKDGLDRIVAIWEFHPETQQQQAPKQVPIDMRGMGRSH